ncbi:MAG: DUF421 domain-containing protein [Actinomycetota bacterium]|nr:DUF421 domain-containing protein [Actinomycetota bacterium]
MWFDSWSEIQRVLLVGTAGYLAVIVVLRVPGKRTLAQLNAFDLVVTVAIGSTLASILLGDDVSLLEGIVGLALLAALQFIVALVASRVKGGRRVLSSTPTVLVSDGRIRADAARRQRISDDEIRQMIRGAGVGDISQIEAVVLEVDGTASVITRAAAGDRSALAGLRTA